MLRLGLLKVHYCDYGGRDQTLHVYGSQIPDCKECIIMYKSP